MLLNSSKPTETEVVAPKPLEQLTKQKREKPPRRPLTWRRVAFIAGLIAWTFIGFMLAQAIGVAIIAGLQAAGVPLQDINPTTFSTAANIIVYTLAIAIIIGLPWWIKKWRTSLKDLGLQRLPRWSDFVWLIVGFLAYLVLTITVNLISRIIFPSADYDQAQDTGFEALSNNFEYILAFVSLVIVAPVAEEIMFRGYLFGKLKKHAAIWVSIVFSSLLFAVAHGQFNVGIDTFALGVVLCLLRLKTDSLWASIMLHMLKNGIAYFFLFISPIVL